MFKHILLPTDGSKLATKGFKAGVKLAKALGALNSLRTCLASAIERA